MLDLISVIPLFRRLVHCDKSHESSGVAVSMLNHFADLLNLPVRPSELVDLVDSENANLFEAALVRVRIARNVAKAVDLFVFTRRKKRYNVARVEIDGFALLTTELGNERAQDDRL